MTWFQIVKIPKRAKELTDEANFGGELAEYPLAMKN
jgi:hypothetical protein